MAIKIEHLIYYSWLQNNLEIFVTLNNFVKIWTSDGYKKKCDIDDFYIFKLLL